MIGQISNYCDKCGRGFASPEAKGRHLCEGIYKLAEKVRSNCPFHVNCQLTEREIEEINQAKARTQAIAK